MKRAIFGFMFLIVFSFCLFAYAEDSGYERIVGDRKYLGRNYIVKNPRATLPPPTPTGIPSAKMDSTLQECCMWGEDTSLTVFQYSGFGPRIATSGETIHVVWWQGYSAKYYREEIFYKRSTDGGITWADSVILSEPDGKSSVSPDIATVGQNVYVVWHDWCSYQDCGVYLRKSTDEGETWLPAVGIALAGPDYYKCHKPAIATKDNEVYVAYGKDIDLDGSLRFKKSTDYGESWGNEMTVSEAAVYGYPPKLAVNSDGLHLVCQHGWSQSVEIFYNRSTDFGDTWESYISISELDDIPSQWPSIAVDDSGNVYITWFDYKYSPYAWTGDIFLRQSTDNGASWDSIISLTENHLCIESDVFADTWATHVVWHDERFGSSNSEIYYRKSIDRAISWGNEVRLTEGPEASYDPRIATYLSKMHVTWMDSRELHTGDLFYKNGYCYIRGDANADRVVNIADAVYLVNYLFIQGFPPFIPESGDANDDEEINIADIVYLINYLFAHGPAPPGC